MQTKQAIASITKAVKRGAVSPKDCQAKADEWMRLASKRGWEHPAHALSAHYTAMIPLATIHYDSEFAALVNGPIGTITPKHGRFS